MGRRHGRHARPRRTLLDRLWGIRLSYVDVAPMPNRDVSPVSPTVRQYETSYRSPLELRHRTEGRLRGNVMSVTPCDLARRA